MGFFEDLIKKADELRKAKNPFYDEQFIRDANDNVNKIAGGVGDFMRNPGLAVSKAIVPTMHRSADVSRPMQRESSDPTPFGGRGVGHIAKQQTDPLEELWGLLNEKYQSSPVDTSFLEQALASQTGAIDAAKNQAQENWRQSDINLEGMHNAFKNDILAQAPKIQEQNQQYQQDLTGIFDKTLQENAARQLTNKAQDAEMFARLGIQPAATQPDIVGQAIEQGNERAVGSRDARLAEAATIGNSELERNTSAANAVGAAGVERRSQLNMRLQDILGQLGGKQADIQSQFAQAKSQAGQENEQRAYERFLRDRDFNMNRYTNEIDYRTKQAQQQGTLSGFDGLQATTNPEVQRAVNDIIATEPNLDVRNPNQVMLALKKKNPNMTPEGLDAALAYVTKYNNLGSTNKFPVG